MAGKEVFALQINGTRREIFAPGDATLLDVLRDDLALRAAKRGCNQGVCGACTIMVDGVPVRGCLTLAGACTGREVTTLEGFADDAAMQALQEAMILSGGVQCGFCTSGMLITARDLVAQTPVPDEPAIRSALSGNLCRCTGYVRIVEAVTDAALQLARQKDTKREAVE
ncbi:MAG: (2Fe-2S)-binding protein [Pararhodobacter sp.]